MGVLYTTRQDTLYGDPPGSVSDVVSAIKLSDFYEIRCRSSLQKVVSRREICEAGLSDSHTLVCAPHCRHLLSVLGETGCRQSADNAVDRLRLT